jgi:opacity protein-like surface antigen
MAAAGLSVNTTSNYEETATPRVTTRVNPNFARNTNFNFIYVLGGGLDYILPDHHWWANLEYNYNHVGTIRTGNGANYETETGINYAGLSLKNTLSASTVLLGLTYYLE